MHTHTHTNTHTRRRLGAGEAWWNRLPSQVVESPSFKILKAWMDRDLSNLVLLRGLPGFEQGVGLVSTKEVTSNLNYSTIL